MRCRLMHVSFATAMKQVYRRCGQSRTALRWQGRPWRSSCVRPPCAWRAWSATIESVNNISQLHTHDGTSTCIKYTSQAYLGEVGLVFLGHGTVLLAAKRNGVVSLVPVAKGVSINLDDSVLHKGVGTDQLVVGGVVHDCEGASQQAVI